MSRLIPNQTVRNVAVGALAPGAPPTSQQKIEDYIERVAKLIPGEAIAAFLAIRAAVPAHGSPGALPPALEILTYVTLVILTPIYLIRFGGNVPKKSIQALIATGSFIVYSYAIGGFFWAALAHALHQEVSYQGFSAVLVVLWSLLVGLLKPGEP